MYFNTVLMCIILLLDFIHHLNDFKPHFRSWFYFCYFHLQVTGSRTKAYSAGHPGRASLNLRPRIYSYTPTGCPSSPQPMWVQ